MDSTMDWPMYRRVERQADRLIAMIDHLDVDRGKLARRDMGAAYAEARGKCLNCCFTRECLSWLEGWRPGSNAPRFCPNISLLEDCRRPAPPDWVI
jgi:Family of unknown function (DUF6455)